jgi:hypothetical protein
VLSPLVWRRMMSEAWQARLIGWTSPCWAVGSAVLLQRSPSRGTGVASSSSSVMVRRVAAAPTDCSSIGIAPASLTSVSRTTFSRARVRCCWSRHPMSSRRCSASAPWRIGSRVVARGRTAGRRRVRLDLRSAAGVRGGAQACRRCRTRDRGSDEEPRDRTGGGERAAEGSDSYQRRSHRRRTRACCRSRRRRAREDITGALSWLLDLGARPPLERRSECGLLYYVFRGPDVRRPLELPDWSALSQP